jgi:hypothetical protein
LYEFLISPTHATCPANKYYHHLVICITIIFNIFRIVICINTQDEPNKKSRLHIQLAACQNWEKIIEGYSKRSVHFQKLLTLNPCPVYGWKGNLSKF